MLATDHSRPCGCAQHNLFDYSNEEHGVVLLEPPLVFERLRPLDAHVPEVTSTAPRVAELDGPAAKLNGNRIPRRPVCGVCWASTQSLLELARPRLAGKHVAENQQLNAQIS